MEYPNSNQIEPEKAKYLYEKHCAIFILENLPPGSEFGIDLASYRTGEKFKGIKLIPPGLHFVYACSSDRRDRQTLGPRCGFFHNFKEREILLKNWSVVDEDFDDSFQPSVEHLSRYSDNLRALDVYLGPYNFSTYEDYKSLTKMLTPDNARRLMPYCGKIRSVPYLIKQSDCVAPSIDRMPRASLTSPKPTEDTIVPDLKPHPDTVIHFTKIPTNHMASSQTIAPEQVTQYNLDTTLKLEHCFAGPDGCNRLLAEFQFAFLTFLLCHIYECFEQWKSILSLVCLADTGLSRLSSEFFLNFIDIMTHQFKHIPEDLFEDIAESNNLVRTHFDIFLQNIESENFINKDLKTRGNDLKKLLVDKFGWKFDIDDEEDRPAIVEL